MEKDIRSDFHAHVLPGLDHGCKDAGMAVKQLSLAKKAGVDRIVATSHFYPHIHTVEDFIEERNASGKLLVEALKENKGAEFPKIVMGAEVLAYKNMDKMPGIDKLCIKGTNVMLLELPFAKKWDEALTDTVRRMQVNNGIHIVIAHADRYSFNEVMKLTEYGIELQLNTSSVCSLAKRSLCKKYIQSGKVVALGSDIHGISKAYKEYSKAVRILASSANEILNKTQSILAECEYEF